MLFPLLELHRQFLYLLLQGLGLFAARDLEKHTMVIEYIGQLIRNEVAEMREKIYEKQVTIDFQFLSTFLCCMIQLHRKLWSSFMLYTVMYIIHNLFKFDCVMIVELIS